MREAVARDPAPGKMLQCSQKSWVCFCCGGVHVAVGPAASDTYDILICLLTRVNVVAFCSIVAKLQPLYTLPDFPKDRVQDITTVRGTGLKITQKFLEKLDLIFMMECTFQTYRLP